MSERKDVLVLAPPAVPGQIDWESRAKREEETIAELEQTIRDARKTIETQQITLRTFTNIIGSLVKVATEMAGRPDLKLILDRKIIDQMEGAKVVVGETDPISHDVYVEVSERAPEHLWGGRHG
jgi:uncharacterized coiled-coil protein SlyX